MDLDVPREHELHLRDGIAGLHYNLARGAPNESSVCREPYQLVSRDIQQHAM